MVNSKSTESSNSQDYIGTDNNLNFGEKTHFDVKRGDIEKIEDTVFGIANNMDGWFLVMGNYAITTPVPTRRECLEHLGDITPKGWDIIFKLIIIVTDHVLLNEKPTPIAK